MKINLIDDENRRELYFEYIFNSLLKIESILEKFTEIQNNLINVTNSIPTFLDLLQKLMNQRFEEIFLQNQDSQKNLNLLAQNQTLLIQLIEKRANETNDKIAMESASIRSEIQKAGFFSKLKQAMKKVSKWFTSLFHKIKAA